MSMSMSMSMNLLSQNGLVDFNHEEEEENDDKKKNNPNINEEIRESMFEKVLTPSDVGKLNRLVIPKQHAERYFPIGGGGDSAEKGEELSFEDESGKVWNFRYSYWNSSQSYVLTKGWSRYVKEKRLRAGDSIVFERFSGGGERLWIGWRRPRVMMTQQDGGAGWAPHGGGHPYPCSHNSTDPLPYQPHCPHAPEREKSSQKQTSSTGNYMSGNCKTVRLFGVDLECRQLDEAEANGPNHPDHLQHYNYNTTSSSHPSTTNHNVSSQCINHVDINFSKDAS